MTSVAGFRRLVLELYANTPQSRNAWPTNKGRTFVQVDVLSKNCRMEKADCMSVSAGETTLDNLYLLRHLIGGLFLGRNLGRDLCDGK